MSVHQIIYTSCKRGIRGVNDGQQIFSFDAAFPEGAMEQVKGMFTYIMPALEPGVVMTEELATTMPQAFIYRRLESGHCAIALNTYLGRDYMGSAGRFGNQLSHVFLFDPADTGLYPCQYFGSDMLRSRMEFEEVNNPNQPDPLPAPVLTPGYRVDVDTVTEFLSEGDRMSVYQNMLWAMLAFESHRKRVVICDEPENIVMWIAALQFALPLNMALNMGFTTYEYDPALSESQICGVVPRGTRFDADSAERHFTFDLLGGSCPEFPKETEFFDFIDTAMSLSYDSIQDFHEFLGRCGYEKADEGIYDAYALYSLLSDGLTDCGSEQTERALRFAMKLGSEDIRRQTLAVLLEKTNLLFRARPDDFVTIGDFLTGCAKILDEEQRQTIRDLVVDRVLYGCVDSGYTEQTFIENFKQAEAVCICCEINLSSELMAAHNRDKLFRELGRGGEGWKIKSILYIIRGYVREQGFSPATLEPGGPMAEVYAGLVQAKATQSAAGAVDMAGYILDDYLDQPEYMLSVMLGLSDALTGSGVTGEPLDKLWDRFNRTVCAKGQRETERVWKTLAQRGMAQRLMSLYLLTLEKSGSGEDACRVYETMEETLVRSPELNALTEPAAEAYFAHLSALPRQESYGYKAALFRKTTAPNGQMLLSDKSLYALEKELLDIMLLGRLEDEERRLCQRIFKYNAARGISLPKKLLPILMGMAFEASKTERELLSTLEGLLRAAGKEKLELTALSSRTAEDYLAWVTPMYTELCQSAETMERVFSCHLMTPEMAEGFISDVLRDHMKESKRDNRALVAFMGIALEQGNSRVRKELTKMVKKLNKNRQEELGEAVEKAWGDHGTLMTRWRDILEEAQAPNPVLETFTSLFRRKNKDKDNRDEE